LVETTKSPFAETSRLAGHSPLTAGYSPGPNIVGIFLKMRELVYIYIYIYIYIYCISLSTSLSLGDYHPLMLHAYHYLQDSLTRTTNCWSRESSNKDVHFRKKILSEFPTVKILFAAGYLIYFCYVVFKFGAPGGTVGWGTALQPEGRGLDFRLCHLNFSLTQSYRLHYGPRIDSTSKQKWVPGIFPGGKSGRCLGLTTLPFSCADCLEIWEPLSSGSGPGSSVSIATDYGLDAPGSNPGGDEFSARLDRPWVPPSLL